MKRTLIRFLVAAIVATAVIFAAGCSDDSEQVTPASGTALITGSIGKTDDATPVTRAAGTMWASGDCIGISASSAKGATAYTNIRYRTPAGDGKFVPGEAGEENTIYFRDAHPVDFTAYYPYEGANGTKPGAAHDGIIRKTLTAADQAADRRPAIDFLWASATAKAPQVAFTFAHRMSCLRFVFEAGDGLTALPAAGVTYTLKGLRQEGTFDTATGTAEASPGATSTDLGAVPVALPGNYPAVKPVSSLILWPQEADKAMLVVTVDGVDFGASLNFPALDPQAPATANGLAAGMSYTYNVKVNRTSVIISVPTIADWTERWPGGLDTSAEEVYTVSYDFNGVTPSGQSVQLPPSLICFPGETFTVSDTSFSGPAGTTFVGWNTLPGGGGTFYAPGAAAVMPGEKMTLYAMWSSDDGSSRDKPRLIFNAESMRAIDNDPGLHYRLVSDLVLTDWVPIGITSKEPFTGTFDGNAHTIRIEGLGDIPTVEIPYNNEKFTGRFGGVFAVKAGSNSEVTRLRVEGNLELMGGGKAPEIIYIGGIAGMVYDSRIHDCIGAADISSISGGGVSDDIFIGGIVGCFRAIGDDPANNAYAPYLYNCYTTGKISNNAADGFVGGIVGWNSGFVHNCVALNSGIFGGNQNCYRISGNGSSCLDNNYGSSGLSALATDKGLTKIGGEDCDALPPASWWVERTWTKTLMDPFTNKILVDHWNGGGVNFDGWNGQTTWEFREGFLPALRRK